MRSACTQLRSPVVVALRLAALVVVSMLVPAVPSQAAEVDPLTLVEPNTVAVLRINAPKRLVEHPIVRDVVGLLDKSALREPFLSPLNTPQLTQLKEFLELSLQKPWDQALEAITADSVVLAVGRKVDGNQPTQLILTTDSEATANGIRDALAAAGLAGNGDIQSADYRGLKGFRLKDSHAAFAGRRMFVCSQRGLLERLADRLLDVSQRTKWQIPERLEFGEQSTRPTGERPVFEALFSLDEARKDEKFAKGLELPTENILGVLAAGGYVDLLGRAKYVTAALHLEGAAMEFRLRADAGRTGMRPALIEFFSAADGSVRTRAAAVPGELLRMAWYRNLWPIYDDGADVLTPTTLEKVRSDSQQQFDSGFIGGLKFLETTSGRQRLYVTTPEEHGYRDQPEKRLPGVGWAISLRDEAAFREKCFKQFVTLIKSPAAAGVGVVLEEQHDGTTLYRLKFHSQIAEKQQGAFKHVLTNYDPAIAMANGEFLLATNASLLKKMLDAGKRSPETAESGMVAPNAGEDLVDLSAVAEFLRTSYRDDLSRDMVLKQGLSLDEAREEVQRLLDVVRRLGRVERRTMLDAELFEISHRVGNGN